MDLTRQSRNQNGARLCLKDQPQRVREPADSGNFERPRANQAAATGAPHTVALRKFASMNKTFTDSSTDEPSAAFGRNHNFLDCGGKRSATPLLDATGSTESGVAAALQSSLRFASAGCHRSPNLCRLLSSSICVAATIANSGNPRFTTSCCLNEFSDPGRNRLHRLSTCWWGRNRCRS